MANCDHDGLLFSLVTSFAFNIDILRIPLAFAKICPICAADHPKRKHRLFHHVSELAQHLRIHKEQQQKEKVLAVRSDLKNFAQEYLKKKG